MRAQTALRTDFASPAFADFPSPNHSATTEHFDRYTILPCGFFRADTESNSAASAPCTSDATTTTARYHLSTALSFDPSNPDAAIDKLLDADVNAPATDGTLALAATPSVALALLEAPPRANPLLAAALAYQDGKIPHEGFHWWPALQQSFYFLLIEHGFRVADDPFLRYMLWHKPFWHDYVASTRHFNFNQWGDGDDFIVNYIGHPMQGGVTGNIQILNDPRGRSLTFGKSGTYWKSRFRALAWSAAYSAQFEAGPILSEAAIGNEGGYFYKPGCDPYLNCAKPQNKPVTNNTGWVDFVVTPTVGMGWIVLEDAIESELTDRWAPGQPDDPLKFKLMRASLIEPSVRNIRSRACSVGKSARTIRI